MLDFSSRMHAPLIQNPFHGQKGFSLIEVIAVISVIGIVAAIALPTVSTTYDSSGATKLHANVGAANSAVQMYLANGGSLNGVTDPAAVLAKLKTSNAAGDAAAGFSGAVVDKRLNLRLQTEAEADSDCARAYWSSVEQKFFIAKAGDVGIKEFYLDEDLAGVDFGTEDRESTTYSVNSADGWIWGYAESSGVNYPRPSAVPIP